MKHIHKVGIKTKRTNKHRFELRYAIESHLIDILPHISFANQTSKYAYKGAHKFIEVDWLIFHSKLTWWNLA